MTKQLLVKSQTSAWYMTQNANYLLYSQLFSNAVWAKTSVTLTSGQTDPNAGTEAFTFTATAANATMLQSVVMPDSSYRTFSIYIKRKTGTGAVSITVDGTTYVTKTITASWVRYDTSLTCSGTVTPGIKLATDTDEVYVAWAQLEDGAVSTNPNLLLYSALFSNAAWTATTLTLAGSQTDPSSGTTAFSATATAANATLKQSVVLTDTATRTFSVYLKRKTGTGAISISADGLTFVTKTITSSWARYSTSISASGTINPTVKIATNADAVYVAWAQLETSSSATTYSETTFSTSTYVTNTANRFTLTQITDVDYPANTTRGCAFLDGRFFVMNAAGEIQQSAFENVASWSALDFIKSQIDPGRGVYLGKINNHIVAFKDWSTEFFYDAANPTASILSPVQNAALQIGCASDASVQDMGGSLIFMGQTQNGFGRSINQLTGTQPQKISTASVDKILNADSLSTVYSWSCNVGSHLLYGLTLVDTQKTLVYDFTSQLWSFFTYLTSSGVSKTITAVTAAGVVTSASHGYSDGDVVLIAGTNSSFNGWHIATDITTNTFQIQATGTAFSGSGTSTEYSETYFPIVASVRANGRQYMQDATSGALYEFSQSAYIDNVGAIAARIRTPELEGENADYKTMASAELIGDKVSSTAVIRYSDDDYATSSSFRPVDLSARAKIRRLGNYRRRSFEILHVKNALLRLKAIELN